MLILFVLCCFYTENYTRSPMHSYTFFMNFVRCSKFSAFGTCHIKQWIMIMITHIAHSSPVALVETKQTLSSQQTPLLANYDVWIGSIVEKILCILSRPHCIWTGMRPVLISCIRHHICWNIGIHIESCMYSSGELFIHSWGYFGVYLPSCAATREYIPK